MICRNMRALSIVIKEHRSLLFKSYVTFSLFLGFPALEPYHQHADANDVRFYTFRRVRSAHGQQSHDCVALTLGRVAKQEEQQEV